MMLLIRKAKNHLFLWRSNLLISSEFKVMLKVIAIILVLFPISVLADDSVDSKFIGYWKIKNGDINSSIMVIRADKTVYLDEKSGTDIIGSWKKISDNSIEISWFDRSHTGIIVDGNILQLKYERTGYGSREQDYERIKDISNIKIQPSYYYNGKLWVISYIERADDWKHEWKFNLNEKYSLVEVVLSSSDGKDEKTLFSYEDIKCNNNINFAFRLGTHKFMDNIARKEHSFSYGFSRVATVSSDCSPLGVSNWTVLEGRKITRVDIALERPKPFPFIFKDGEFLLATYHTEKNGKESNYYLKLRFKK